MGLFSEKFCKECGGKAALIGRVHLIGDDYLCSKCLKAYPQMIKDSMSKYTYEEYQNLKEYMNYSDAVLSRVFRETHSYSILHLDQDNGLFYLDLQSPRVYLQVGNILNLNFLFEPEKVKEGMLSTKVKGKVTLELSMIKPIIEYKQIIDYSAKADADVNFFGTKVKYQNPKDVDKMIEAFNKSSSGLNL